MFPSDRRSFENCSQLTNLIRYQLGDPQEFIIKNNCSFLSGSYFAYAEGNRDHYRSEESTPYRHAVNFSWVILPQQLEIPEKSSISPFITINNCQRDWRLTINIFKGNQRLEYDVYLWCFFCKDASIRAYVKMDLYRGTDKIGEDAETRVLFDTMIDRHLVYTGAISKCLGESVTKVDLGKAYTIQGILRIMHCCVDEK